MEEDCIGSQGTQRNVVFEDEEDEEKKKNKKKIYLVNVGLCEESINIFIVENY